MSELVTREWLWRRVPANRPPKNMAVKEPLYNANYEGRYGRIAWQGSKDGPSFTLWINGNVEELGTITVQRLLLIMQACEIDLPPMRDFEDF